MLDIESLRNETSNEMLKYFKRYDLANYMEPTESQLKDTPACYLYPMTEDPRGETFSGSQDQATDETISLVIVAKVEDLYTARRHAKAVFRGHKPNPQEVEIPFHEMLFAGGEIRSIKSNTCIWMDMYRTYTLGGC